ncbi:MAG: thiopurine S-methyltransferase [Pseudomonadota bacterium]
MIEKDSSLKGPNSHWLQRWEEQNIGWHHEEFNPHLLNHWSALSVPGGSLVLAPLCGKSRDMVWLAERGYRLRGIELSPLAIETFFMEQGLQPERETVHGFERWSAGPYEIFCGDIFDLEQLDNSQVDAVYDRASLVALNPVQRRHYVQLLKRLLPERCPVLLVAMDYSQHEMTGPPYSVDETEVRGLFRSDYEVTMLDSLDLLNESERYREQGLSRIFEQIYQLLPQIR